MNDFLNEWQQASMNVKEIWKTDVKKGKYSNL